MIENNRTEYKRQLTDDLEKGVVAFLNSKDGGIIYPEVPVEVSVEVPVEVSVVFRDIVSRKRGCMLSQC